MLKINTRRYINSTFRLNGAFKYQGNESLSGGFRNIFAGGFDEKSGISTGALSPQAFVLPQKPGSMASQTDSFLTISKTDATLIPAINLLFSASSSIEITQAQLDQIVQMLLSAGASLSTTQAILSGAANAEMSASGSITVTQAQCGAIIDILASGSSSITPNMFLTALASMNCEIGGPTPLSPEGLAQAVWSSKINENKESGSFGLFIQKLLNIVKFLGLK
jgi:hypothetical protein